MYREAPEKPVARPPLFSVWLARGLLVVQRVLLSARLIAVAIVIVTYFLPWHVVRTSSLDLGCVFMPDCHPSPAPSNDVTVGGMTCTGFSHYQAQNGHGWVPLTMLVLLAIASAVPLRRMRLRGVMLADVAAVAIFVGLLYALFDLTHMFDHVTYLRAQAWFDRVLGVVALLTLIDFVVQPLLYVWQRARHLPT